MIRRFFGMIIFTATVLVASFGQNLFGRSDLVNWAHTVQKEGPKHASNALNKTDDFLSHLSPSAGIESPDSCTPDIDWAKVLYKA
jgi:hypothetical protein